jgi:hypothetical protein
MTVDRTTRKMGEVLDGIAVRLPVPEPRYLDPAARAILEGIDGIRRIRDIARALNIKTGDAIRATLDLIAEGQITFLR